MLAAAEDTGAVLFLFLVVVGLIITVAWIVFPFIVISKCNEMIKLLGRSNQALQQIQDETTRTRDKLEILHRSCNEITKAMQFMIDSWPKQ